MRLAIAALIVLSVAPALASAQAGGWNLYGPDGTYQGRISREQDGTLNRYGADGRYQGHYDRSPNQGRISSTGGWNAYDAQGRYQGRITGQGERGMPAVIGAGQQ